MNMYRMVGLFLVAVLLAGCGGGTQILGYERRAPDEFTVISRAPLTLPPSYNLRPPGQESASAPKDESPRTSAREALTEKVETRPRSASGETQEGAGVSLSAGERILLEKTGAENVAGGIRRQVNREASAPGKKDLSFTEKLMFWRVDEDPSAVLVDAPQEHRRIQENKALGKPVTEGRTPVIKREEKGLLEDLF